MRTLKEIISDELDAAYPLDTLDAGFDDYDLDCQVFCEFMDEESI